jgi:hypothetical protein
MRSKARLDYTRSLAERRQTAMPFGTWLAQATDLGDGGDMFRDLATADPDFPATAQTFAPIRQHLVDFGIPKDGPIMETAHEVWGRYWEAQFGDLRNPSAVTRVCQDCGGPRSLRSQGWCRSCAIKRNSANLPKVRADKAAHARERLAERVELAELARRALESQGMNVAEVVQSLVETRNARKRKGHST